MNKYPKEKLIEFKKNLQHLSDTGKIICDREDFGVDLNNCCIHYCTIQLVENLPKH